MRELSKSQFLILVMVLLPFMLQAAAPAKAPDKPKGLTDRVELKALKYRSIGPAWGGRVTRAAGVPGDPNLFYFSGAASGVWKSVDGGSTWKSIFDDQPCSSIGSLAIAPSNSNILYVGAGEANIRGNVAAGNGIYKTMDAGKTWTHVWTQEGQIGKMIVHPTNPDIAFAAVLGHAFGPNPERGVYRTVDGGKTWIQVLKKDADTGASDVAFDPSNPNVLFAGLWQARRTPWSMTSGGPGSGLYVSHDGGDTWKQLTGNGLPDGIWGKIGVAVAPSDSRRVYALIEAEKGGLFRSDDGGENWALASANRLVRQRAWYYSTLTVHPQNPNEIWFPQVPLLKSVDGGQTFGFVKVPHGDNHDLWIDPKDPKRMIGADDGGVLISHDGGETWVSPPLPISQFYHVSVDTRVPFYVAGAMQDIGTAQGPSRSLNNKGIRNSDWYNVGGGEAGWVVSDTSDPNIVYAGEYSGYISRYDHRTEQQRNVSIYPENGSGHGAIDLKYRFQWTAPIAVSPHNPKVIYHGGNVVFRTEDGGQTWNAISPDLTRNDKAKQQWSGGPITGDNTGVEVYDTIFVIAESPLQKDLIWVGTDDGLVQVTQDGGKNWSNATGGMNGAPEWGTVSMIEPSRYNAGTAYVTVEAHRLDNTKPYLFKTTDFGKSWVRLDSALPQDIYLHSVREDSKRNDMLYLGTERGVAYTTDSGKTWQSLKSNLPTVAVHDLQVKENSLVVGTLGRSLWIFDHLSVLREIPPQMTGSTIHLFSAPDAIRWQLSGIWPVDLWLGENPPGLAQFYYWLKDAPKGDVTIDILDSQGKVINNLSSKPKEPIGNSDNSKEEIEGLKKAALAKEAGVQMGSWDLRYAGADMVQNAKQEGNPDVGPLVSPGTYTVRLTSEGKSETTALRVMPDPRVQMSDAEYKEMTDFALSVGREVSRLTHMVQQARKIRQQMAARNELLKNQEQAGQLVKDSEALIAKLDALEDALHNPKAEVGYDILARGAKLYSRMGNLYYFTIEGDGPPTQGVRETFAAQKQELDQFDSQLKQLISSDLAALNESARKLDLPTVLP